LAADADPLPPRHSGLSQIVTGVDRHKVFVDGDDVCVIYDGCYGVSRRMRSSAAVGLPRLSRLEVSTQSDPSGAVATCRSRP